MLKGIDVSHWQGVGTIAKMKPCDFAIIKMTEGASYIDPACTQHVQEARKIGALVGCYHFARPDRGNIAIGEADNFVTAVRGCGLIGSALLVLDFEGKAVSAANFEWAYIWLHRVYDRTGVKPVIYLSASVLKKYSDNSWLKAIAKDDFGLWVAQWPKNKTNIINGSQTRPNVNIEPWSLLALWQWAGGEYNGVDQDYFYGDADAWLKYAASDNSQGSVTEDDSGKCHCGCSNCCES